MEFKSVWNEIESKSHPGTLHSVRLIFTMEGKFLPKESSCTCPWGSWYRWRKKNKTLMCRHIIKAMIEYAKENKLKEVKIEIK